MTMGIGYNLPRQLIVKRRFRWTFQVFEPAGGIQSAVDDVKIDPIWVKLAMRPNFTSEELELNYLNERAYLSGKPQWEPITLTLLDTVDPNHGKVDAAHNIRCWAQRVYMYGAPDGSGSMGDGGKFYKKDATLNLYDGIGEVLETWTLFGVWPQQINWGDLDYTNNDSADVEITLRFDNAIQKLAEVKGGRSAQGLNTENGMVSGMSMAVDSGYSN